MNVTGSTVAATGTRLQVLGVGSRHDPSRPMAPAVGVWKPTDDAERPRPMEAVTTFISPLGVPGKRMTPGLSDSDWDRIRQFAEKSLYDRNPDMLVPAVEDDDLE